MPVCDLIVGGKNFDVDEYIKSSPFNEKARVFHCGEAFRAFPDL